MSPNAALQSDVFRLYVVGGGGILLTGGAVLAALAWGPKKDVGKIWVTYRAWLIMAPAVMGLIFAGREAIVVACALASLLGLKEFARATGLYGDWWMTGTVYLAIAALSIATLMADPFTGNPGWFGLFMSLPVFVIATILLLPILRNRTQGQLQTISLAILGFIYIGWMFGHLAFLANASPPYGYLLYVTLAVALNDVAAFTFGRLFGRHHLRSQISPNKTWEGALGALAVSMALPWVLGFSFPHFGPVQRVLAGLIVGVGGQLGDLSISVIKRDLGIKDMGAVIPGHGGILDRIDSLIYVAPLFLHMVNYFYGLR